jgi:hypothetical protein
MSAHDPSLTSARRGRPPLLTVLAWLAGLDGVVTAAIALVRLGGAGGPEGAPWWDSFLALLLGIFLLVAAVGVFLGRPWGRWTGTGAFGMALVLQLWEVVRPLVRDVSLSTVTLSLRGLSLALLVSVVVYLNLRPATEWFHREDGAGAGR